jgi:hypothetical protein
MKPGGHWTHADALAARDEHGEVVAWVVCGTCGTGEPLALVRRSSRGFVFTSTPTPAVGGADVVADTIARAKAGGLKLPRNQPILGSSSVYLLEYPKADPRKDEPTVDCPKYGVIDVNPADALTAAWATPKNESTILVTHHRTL